MSAWYLGTDPLDPSKILSILEMAKEMNVLPVILSASSFPLIFDLACWAAKRDYLKLDKWVTDKAREQKVLVRATVLKSLQLWALGVEIEPPYYTSLLLNWNMYYFSGVRCGLHSILNHARSSTFDSLP